MPGDDDGGDDSGGSDDGDTMSGGELAGGEFTGLSTSPSDPVDPGVYVEHVSSAVVGGDSGGISDVADPLDSSDDADVIDEAGL